MVILIGPGEQGKPVYLDPQDDKEKEKESFQANGFSAYISDKISLDRALPDTRHLGYYLKQITAFIGWYLIRLNTIYLD